MVSTVKIWESQLRIIDYCYNHDMSEQLLQTILSYLTVVVALVSGLLLALWLSLVIWAYRDMRLRSRDPFAYFLAALVVAVLPIVGILVYLILRPPQTLAQAYQQMLEEEALLQEIENRPVCPGCSRTVDKNWLVCAYCHTRLKKACPDCNSLMELQWTLCPFCGNHHIDPYQVALRPEVELGEETAVVAENKEEEERLEIGD